MKYQDKQKRIILFKILWAAIMLLLVVFLAYAINDSLQQRQYNRTLSQKFESVMKNHQIDKIWLENKLVKNKSKNVWNRSKDGERGIQVDASRLCSRSR